MHSSRERHLRGVPVDSKRYDYRSQARWKRESGGELWRYTLTYLRRALPEFAYVSMRELQLRGTQHVHVLTRLPADAPADVAETVRDVTAKVRVTAFDGFKATWGEQVDVRDLGVIGAANDDAKKSAASTVRYIGKVVEYMAKDLLGHVAEHGERGARLAAHLGACEDAAREARCSPKCPQGLACTCLPRDTGTYEPGDFASIAFDDGALSEWLIDLPKRDKACPVHSRFCQSNRHSNFGASAHTITVSHSTEKRWGWSFSGHTRAHFQ
ncbi:replication initiator [Leucobacter celer]|uniref:replication initiator n=1 Tax=Leucobacter celer TaxID=668625 RepID=UPI0034CEFEE5